MTAQARQVLEDCKIALQLLESETDLRRWRIHWVAALALIRAVGSVLDKVDGRDPRIHTVSSAAYRRWKGGAAEHQIFREFIKKDRDSILKEYEFNVHPQEEVEILLMGTLQRVSDGTLVDTAEVIPIGENIYRPLLQGFREGDDARDVLSEAIGWWEKELLAIEQALRE